MVSQTNSVDLSAYLNFMYIAICSDRALVIYQKGNALTSNIWRLKVWTHSMRRPGSIVYPSIIIYTPYQLDSHEHLS